MPYNLSTQQMAQVPEIAAIYFKIPVDAVRWFAAEDRRKYGDDCNPRKTVDARVLSCMLRKVDTLSQKECLFGDHDDIYTIYGLFDKQVKPMKMYKPTEPTTSKPTLSNPDRKTITLLASFLGEDYFHGDKVVKDKKGFVKCDDDEGRVRRLLELIQPQPQYLIRHSLLWMLRKFQKADELRREKFIQQLICRHALNLSVEEVLETLRSCGINVTDALREHLTTLRESHAQLAVHEVDGASGDVGDVGDVGDDGDDGDDFDDGDEGDDRDVGEESDNGDEGDSDSDSDASIERPVLRLTPHYAAFVRQKEMKRKETLAQSADDGDDDVERLQNKKQKLC